MVSLASSNSHLHVVNHTMIVESPQPQRPTKRGILEVESMATPVTKRMCLSPQSSSKPSIRSHSDSFLLGTPPSKPTRKIHAPDEHEGELTRSRTQPSAPGTPVLPPPSPSLCSSIFTTDTFRLQTPSTAESRSSIRVSQPNYRDNLQCHNIWIEPRNVSSEVIDYASSVLRTNRHSPGLTDSKAQAAVEHFRVLQGDADEGTIRAAFSRFDIIPSDLLEGIKQGFDTPFDATALPHETLAPPLPRPKPDLHYAFSSTSFNKEQKYKLSKKTMRSYSTPSMIGHWPFFTVEFKSQAKGGTIWIAENQVATSCAQLVYSMEQLLSLTNERRKQIDSIVFGCTIDAKNVGIWAAYHEKEERNGQTQTKLCCVEIERYMMSRKDEIMACYSAIRNIHNWAIEERLPKIISTLDELEIDYPCLMDKRAAADPLEALSHG